MKVAGLSENDDWQFGRGRATYLKNSDAVAQNVKTRIREFKQDWFANVEKGIDWITYLGNRSTQEDIEDAVRTTTLQTEGVATLDSFEIIVNRRARSATIRLSYTDVYSQTFDREFEVGNGA